MGRALCRAGAGTVLRALELCVRALELCCGRWNCVCGRWNCACDNPGHAACCGLI